MRRSRRLLEKRLKIDLEQRRIFIVVNDSEREGKRYIWRRWQAMMCLGIIKKVHWTPRPRWYCEERRWERRLWGILTKWTDCSNKDLMHLSILMQWKVFLAHLIVHCKYLVGRLPHGDSGKQKQALPILSGYWYPLPSSHRDRKGECGALRWEIFMGQS